MATAELPNRSLFKAPEVCEIAQLQPYVLRSWEAEFPDLGVTRSGSAGRVYRRHDVERVLRLKHLLFVEGLTLAGARRRLEEERTPLPTLEEVSESEAGVRRAHGATPADKALRRQLEQVQQGLRSLLELLEARKAEAPAFELQRPPAHRTGDREKPRKAPAKAQKAAAKSRHGR
jgi:DNA-binding transcriptional MerR regulator